MLDVAENKIQKTNLFGYFRNQKPKVLCTCSYLSEQIHFKRNKLTSQNKNSEIVWVTVAKDFEEHKNLSVKYS